MYYLQGHDYHSYFQGTIRASVRNSGQKRKSTGLKVNQEKESPHVALDGNNKRVSLTSLKAIEGL